FHVKHRYRAETPRVRNGRPYPGLSPASSRAPLARGGLADMAKERNQRRRRDAGDPAGRTKRRGAHRLELLAHFGREAADRVVIERGGQGEALVAAERADIRILALEIAAVPRLDLELLGN